MSQEFQATGALAAAAAHFDQMRGQTIEVPEWGTAEGPLVIHFDPITAAQAESLQKRAKGSEVRLKALAVILGAKDAEGRPIFEDNAGTLATLMSKVDPRVTTRVALRILGADDDTAEGRDDLGN